MKTRIIALALAAAGLVSVTTTYAAFTTHAVAVSATVTGKCRFEAASGATLAFGVIDPLRTTAVTTSGTTLYRCNSGLSPTITADDGLNAAGPGAPQMSDGTTNFLKYTFTIDSPVAGTGHGSGQGKTLTIRGSVAVADFAAAAAATFNDTLTLTIAP